MSRPHSLMPTTGRAQLETLLGDLQSSRDHWDEFAAEICAADNLQGIEGAPPFPTIARFEYRALLGRGGCGIVFKARDTRLERLVALKLCLVNTPHTAAAIEREAKMLARVSHHNVVSVYEVGCHEGTVYFVMEYLAGRNAGWLVKNPPNWREVIALYRDAGRGLAAAHDEQIIHSDFKPANVVLDKHGRPKVADFGLARMMAEHRLQTDEDADLGSPYGTPGYIAPEILRGQHSDARSDQWSFCVSVWETIDGKRPFPGLTRKTILESLEHGPRVIKLEVPERVRDVLRVGLSIDPGERYPDMHALIDEFDELLALEEGTPASNSAPTSDDAPELVPHKPAEEGPSRVVSWSVFVGSAVSALLMMIGIFLWPEFIGLRSTDERLTSLPIPRPRLQDHLETFKAVQTEQGLQDVKSKIADGEIEEASEAWLRLDHAKLVMGLPTTLGDIMATTAFVEYAERMAAEGKMEEATKAAQVGLFWSRSLSREHGERLVTKVLDWRMEQAVPAPRSTGTD